MCEAHFGGVGEPLRQEVACDRVLVLGRFSGVNGLGIRVEARKEGPSAGHLHHVTEAHLKDGPVRTIVLEARYVGRELLDGGRGDGGRW